MKQGRPEAEALKNAPIGQLGTYWPPRVHVRSQKKPFINWTSRRRSVKKESLVGMAMFFMLFLPCAAWAQLAQCAEPNWRDLKLDLQGIAPSFTQFVESFGGGENGSATCTASCGALPPVSCSGLSCSAVDQDCLSGQAGYVVCGSTFIPCGSCDAECRTYNGGGCRYSWDPSSLCCVAEGCSPVCY